MLRGKVKGVRFRVSGFSGASERCSGFSETLRRGRLGRKIKAKDKGGCPLALVFCHNLSP